MGAVVVAAASLALLTPGASALAAAPKVLSTSVSHVTTGAAMLEAQINPEGSKVEYHFEYGPSDCAAEPDPCATSPSLEGVLAAKSTPEAVKASLEGLSPGTVYHLRVIAASAKGATPGPDTIFTTYPPSGFGPCLSDAFRTGQPSASLPDCRAYEQASPVDKSAQDARGTPKLVRAGAAGGRVSFITTNGIPGGEGGQDLPTYLASRGGGEWSVQGLLPAESAGPEARVLGWTPDFSQILDSASTVEETPELGQFLSTAFLARSGADGSLAPITPYLPNFEPSFAGATADGSLVLFEARVALPGVAGAIAGKPNLYLWDRASGTVRLAGVLNGEPPVPPSKGALAGSYDWEAGTTPESLETGGALLQRAYYTQDNRVLADDGSSLYFTAAGAGALYQRRNPTQPQSALDGEGKCTKPLDACTVEVSASQKANGGGEGGRDAAGARPAAFALAAADGSAALFTSSEKLTEDATTGPEPDAPAIARANLADGGAKDLKFLLTGAAGIAVFGEHLYWADPSKNAIGRAKLNGTGAPSEVEAEFIAGADNPQGVAVDAEHVYWTNAADEKNGDGSIGRAKIDGEPLSINEGFIAGADNPRGIAVDVSHVYWVNAEEGKLASENGHVARAELDGGTVEAECIEAANGDVALSASKVFYSRSNGVDGFVREANLDCSGEENVESLNAPLAGAKEPPPLATDASHIYFANPSTSVIGRADLDGSEAVSFVTEAGRPRGLALDGEHIYWSSNQGLQANSGNDLYRYEAASGKLSDLVVDEADENGAEVRGVLGASADARRVYFTANGDLDGTGPATSEGGCHGETLDKESGACNLYLSQPDPAEPDKLETRFIARVAGGDHNDWRPNASEAGTNSQTSRSSRVSPDGETLLFASTRQLTTPYDNKGVSELYRYSAADGALRCVSCNPSGASPRGAPSLGGNLNLSALEPPSPAALLSRNLSASGKQVFFETTDALVPEDTNGEPAEGGGEECPVVGPFNGRYPSCLDVYEWEAKGAGSCESEIEDGGCLYLLSPGRGGASFFGDASASGDDAFLFTRTGLVGQDKDQLLDVYDARKEGGLASQNQPPKPECEGEGCKPATSAPPAFASPQTPRFAGPANPRQKPASKCPKGKQKVKVKGKSRCLAAKKHGKRNHRAAKPSGRTGR
jgi:virginiamycin B lyase